MSTYDTAQICKNGHVITSYANGYASSRENYCSDCGSQTMMQCPKCNQAIKGSATEYGYLGTYIAPSYCYACGNPFPWTSEKLSVARELIELDSNLLDEDITELSNNMEFLISETPRTNLAAMKFKKFLSKAGSTTASALKDILVDIASETAKKIIWS
ncbi:DUF2321 domain-containing protein [Clostridium sp.]|uniref:DUF2321 domain-containing protein n=1 Tax=Clostridium sp. TaxID=1506 RepID=UPI001A5C249E|nr:DUF2321 domain-containing protein [Clostridium sp.]MBK5236684.1 DUF2321 domain-containing protein [Clostridium sp.]